MKKILSLLMASLVLLLAGCGVSDQDVKDSIPTLSLETSGSTTEIPAYSYSWTVTNRWGNSASMAADTAHPLEAQDDLTSLTLTAGAEAVLTFSKIPDSVSVVFWRADETDYESSTQVEATYRDGSFVFTVPGADDGSAGSEAMVYSVTALWNSYDDVSGTVTYAFTTATA